MNSCTGVEARKNNLIVFSYLIIIVTLSLTCSLFIVFDNTKPIYYSSLSILPLIFALCSCIALNVYKHLFKKVSITIIILTYFIRMVVLPFIIYLGDYSILFGNYNVVIPYDLLFNNMGKAISLMGYEALIIFTTIATSNFTDNRKELNKNFLDLKSESTKKSLFFKGTIFAMILFVFTCLLIFPSLKNYISFFIAGSEEENIRNYIRLLNIRANVPSIIYWIYIMFVDLLQIFLPIVLIEYIFKKIGRHNTKRALLLSFCIIFMVLLFMTPEKARSIQLAVSLFLVLHFIYPQHIRKIIPFALVFVSIFSLIALLLKSGVYREESDLWGFVSETLNAYFSGPLNVVASISMQQNSSIKLIISDILNSLPFVKHYFMEWDTTPKYFNYSIKGTGATVSKIIPMIGQGYFYFGFLLSPIISIISIKVAMKLEKIANLTTNIFKRYLYIFATINFALSPVLYNFNISLSTFWDIIIILILMKLADLKLRKKTIGI